MVNSGSPDNPQEGDDDWSTSQAGHQVVLEGGSSSDDETDAAQLAMYMPLAQAPGDADASDSEDTDDDNDENTVPPSEITTSPAVTSSTDLHTDDAGPSTSLEDKSTNQAAPQPEQRDIPLNSEQVDQIRAAMANVILPPSSVPPWAATITEEEATLLLQRHVATLRGDLDDTQRTTDKSREIYKSFINSLR